MSDGVDLSLAHVPRDQADEVALVRTGPQWRVDGDGFKRFRGLGKPGAPRAIVQLRIDAAQVIKLIRQAVCSLQESADEPDRKIRRATIAEAWGKMELSGRFLDDILTRHNRECGDTTDKPAPHVCDTCGSTSLAHLDLVDGPSSEPWVMPQTAEQVDEITFTRRTPMALSAAGWVPIGEVTLQMRVSPRQLRLRDAELRPIRDEHGRRWYQPAALAAPKPAVMTAAQIAAMWGCSIRCVYDYDEKLRPTRTPTGRRRYDPAVVLGATPPRRYRSRKEKSHG